MEEALGCAGSQAPATLGYKYMKLELQIPHSQSGDWERDKQIENALAIFGKRLVVDVRDAA